MTLLINVAVLLAMVFAARRWIEPTEAGRQLLFWINLAAPIVATGLLSLAAFFWLKNGTFRIAVNDTHFELVDPLSDGASFSVPVGEIVEIRQIHEKTTNYSRILMRMRSGERHQITMNRSFDRGALYAALARVNPTIQLPENPLLFKQV